MAHSFTVYIDEAGDPGVKAKVPAGFGVVRGFGGRSRREPRSGRGRLVTGHARGRSDATTANIALSQPQPIQPLPRLPNALDQTRPTFHSCQPQDEHARAPQSARWQGDGAR